MDRFAEATGLDSGAPVRRYLWTDAFAVCNWIALGELDRAVSLVEAVHAVLGRHREDDPREGWISGLPAEEGARRPTAGGLRIGKPLPERGPEQVHRPRLEWDRDGQYFHYLTRWMRALLRVFEVTGEDRYLRWAAELGRVAYERFSHGPGREPSLLYWKMSIDLSRPLVQSMGQHDPLDGYVVLSELQDRGGEELEEAIRGLAGMGQGADWATADPLGAGSLLSDSLIMTRLVRHNGPERRQMLSRVLNAAARSVRQVDLNRSLSLPASGRLAFRELGLAIGLEAVTRLPSRIDATVDSDAMAALRAAGPRSREITAYWLDSDNQVGQWFEHDAINTVMLATALVPDGYLGTVVEPG
jgi:hypothetical protein